MMCKPSPMQTFANVSDLVDTLSEVIVERLSSAVADRGRASLVVPGGESPKHLFDGLAGRYAPWSKVDIALTDERWAPQTPTGSNEHHVRARLLKGRAAEARFTSFCQADTLPGARDHAETAIARFARPFDVTVVGMGEDGHVASLFPHRSVLHPGALVEVVERQGALVAKRRLTLTLQALQDSRFIALLITGQEKLNTLRRAAAGEATPIGALLEAGRGRLEVFCAP